MKIIFLDMDGVLNTSSTKAGMFDCYEPYLVDKLNYLTDQTDSVIVLTSTWRLAPDKIWLFDHLKNTVGIKGTIIGYTPKLIGPHMSSYVPRGDEIAAWLKLYMYSGPIDGFVIIDDEVIGAFEGFEDYFVNTEMAIGLTDKNVEKAIEILNKQVNFLVISDIVCKI